MRPAARLLAALLLPALAGCAAAPQAQPHPPAAPPQPAPLFSPLRIDAAPGDTLLLPLQSFPASAEASLDDGSRLPCDLLLLDAQPRPPANHVWLDPPLRWSATPADRAPAFTPGVPVAMLVLPDTPRGDWLTLGEQRWRLNWLPSTAALAAVADPAAFAPARDPALPDSILSSPRFIAEALDPRSRWRWRLLADGLRPDDHPHAIPAEPFADPAAEALARNIEFRWRAALLRLHAADPALCARLKRRLAAVADFGNREFAPVWPTDPADLESLLASLLEPDSPPPRLVTLADAWLSRQAPAHAWVVDDGSVLDQSRAATLASITVLSTFDRATLTWAAPADPSAPPSMFELPAYASAALLAGVPAPTSSSDPAASVKVHAGRWSADLPFAAAPRPVVPPGATLGPFAADWDLRSWQAARPSLAPWPTIALLHRPAHAQGAEPSASRSKPWEIFIECFVQPGIGEAAAEEVRLCFGPPDKPAAILRVTPSGSVEHLPLPGRPLDAVELLPPPASVRVVRSADRWSFRVSVPPGGVEPDGLIRLGIVRVDALGRRSAWPRPMLPWQAQPPRAALDTRPWSAATDPADFGSP